MQCFVQDVYMCEYGDLGAISIKSVLYSFKIYHGFYEP